MMQDKLKAAFDSVRAEEALKQSTLSHVRGRCGGEKKRRPALLRLAPDKAQAESLFRPGWGWCRRNTDASAVIGVDVNPSLELSLNRFDRVVGVAGWNEDGTALAETVELRNLDCAAALEALFTSPAMEAYLTGGAQVSIVVVGEDAAQQERLLTQAAACTAGQGNFHCGAAAPETMEAAHESGLSCGKYLAYLELKALDPDVTVEEAEGMTMAELRRAIAALSGEEADAAYPGRGSGGSGNGSGNGNGHHGHHGRSASCARETVSSAAFGSRFFPVCP